MLLCCIRCVTVCCCVALGVLLCCTSCLAELHLLCVTVLHRHCLAVLHPLCVAVLHPQPLCCCCCVAVGVASDVCRCCVAGCCVRSGGRHRLLAPHRRRQHAEVRADLWSSTWRRVLMTLATASSVNDVGDVASSVNDVGAEHRGLMTLATSIEC